MSSIFRCSVKAPSSGHGGAASLAEVWSGLLSNVWLGWVRLPGVEADKGSADMLIWKPKSPTRGTPKKQTCKMVPRSHPNSGMKRRDSGRGVKALSAKDNG